MGGAGYLQFGRWFPSLAVLLCGTARLLWPISWAPTGCVCAAWFAVVFTVYTYCGVLLGVVGFIARFIGAYFHVHVIAPLLVGCALRALGKSCACTRHYKIGTAHYGGQNVFLLAACLRSRIGNNYILACASKRVVSFACSFSLRLAFCRSCLLRVRRFLRRSSCDLVSLCCTC